MVVCGRRQSSRADSVVDIDRTVIDHVNRLRKNCVPFCVARKCIGEMNDDWKLLAEYATNHSEEAFATLVGRHVDMVYSVAVRQVSDSHLAEEITQATFIILAQKSGKLSDTTIIPAWLCRTARYVSANALKTQHRRQQREHEAYMQSQLNESEPDQWHAIAPQLDTAMAQLNSKDHDAIVLRFFEHRSLGEIGRMLGISEDAAKKRVTRALQKLRLMFRKKGIAVTTGIIATGLSTTAVQAAPTGLAATVSTAATQSGAIGGSTLALTKGTLKVMAWAKAKVAIAVATVAVAATVGTMIVSHAIPPREPSYEGRRLSEWLPDIDYGQPADKRAKAAEAIRHMGEATLPFLLSDLVASKDSPVKRVRYEKPDDRSVDQRSRQASWAFDALGAAGKSAIPQLLMLMEQNPGYVPSALAHIGRDAIPYIIAALTNDNVWVRNNAHPAIANAVYSEKVSATEVQAAVPFAIRNLNDTNSNTRWRAAELLQALGLQPEQSVPALARGLSDTNAAVAEQCADSLNSFGLKARSAVPQLRNALSSTNSNVRFAAAQALASIDPRNANKSALLVLKEFLTHSNAVFRMYAVESIGNFGENAESLVPDLIRRGDDENAPVRGRAAQAIGDIARNPDLCIPTLTRLLQDGERGVRLSAINALRQFGTAAQPAVPALKEAATDPKLKDTVSAALAKIVPKEGAN